MAIFRRTLCPFFALLVVLHFCPLGYSEEPLTYTILTEKHFDPPQDKRWSQVRASAFPANGKEFDGAPPHVIMTMQPVAAGTHTYLGIASSVSKDLGKTWSDPVFPKTLTHHDQSETIYEVPVDSTPAWHQASGKVLLTGATFFVDRKIQKDVPKAGSDTFYSSYDPKTQHWEEWQALKMPESFKWPYKRSGCGQRFDLPNGEILLPVYFGEHNNSIHYATIVRCSFDGKTLKYLEHGSEHHLDFGRGMSEPSIAKFKDQYFLTMRNDKRAYISVGTDGLHYSEAEPWMWEDGTKIGSYNTQAHFMTHSDALFLLYTRRGANNDNVMRHRAPIFMAQINPETHRLIRETDRVVVEREGDLGMGNFGVCNITPDESWVVVAPDKFTGGKNVRISRIHWSKPNKLVD